MLIEVSVVSPMKVLYEGNVKSAVFPGESGVFEVLPFHKSLLSRLISGVVRVGGKEIKIKRGVVKVHENKVDAIVEEQ